MSEDRNSCPRCADYDRVVEEVENLKQQRTKEVKSLLDDCEQTRSQLQKKVTTMTVVPLSLEQFLVRSSLIRLLTTLIRSITQLV